MKPRVLHRILGFIPIVAGAMLIFVACGAGPPKQDAVQHDQVVTNGTSPPGRIWMFEVEGRSCIAWSIHDGNMRTDDNAGGLSCNWNVVNGHPGEYE